MSARTHWGWSVLAILALFCATVGLVYVSVSISLVGGYVAALWPVNAIVLSLIATQPRHRWALILLVVYTADALTNTVLMGSRWPLALGLAATNTMEVALASWLLFRDQRRFDVSSVSDLGRFGLVAVLVAPLLASSVAALLIPSSRPYADVLLRWFSSDALGMLVFAPVLLAVLVPDRRRVRR
ncbi:MAG: MASE1 domain-containing protein, partial [Xanthomonadales bacterium]|nr:MASE1 domain-containing protein [Xanthomonadales bacterium]